MVRYLHAESMGHETTAVRLSGLRLGANTKDDANIVVGYSEEAREILPRVALIAGETRKLAVEITKRHEIE